MSGRRARVTAILLVAALLGAGCATKDGGTTADGTRTSAFQRPCEDFCQHLRALGCPEGQPLASGTSCEKFCVDTQEAGHDLQIACVLKIRSCGELQSCNR